MRSNKKIRQLKFLITAGGTREYIDPVRFISNASSGKMGCELARAARSAGHNVTLITTIRDTRYDTQRSGEPASEIRNTKPVYVETADQMFKAVKKYFPECDCLIMTAAVSDWTPVKTSRVKIKKSSRLITLKLKPTADILKWAGHRKRKNQLVVGFALEDGNLKISAERKMRDKNLDMVIANTPAAIGSEQSKVWIKKVGEKWQLFPEMRKSYVARQLISMIEHRES